MEIIVVDDHSSDDPETVVRALAHDRVRYVRQARNVGLVANLNRGIQEAAGELVHVLHGDDCVLDGFYAAMGAVLDTEPTTGAAFCRVIYRDERSGTESTEALLQERSGLIPQALERILLSGPQTSSVVVRRGVYQVLGGFDSRFTCSCEDWEMWVRIALRYPIGYEPTPLAKYRFMRSGSLTAVHRETGGYARDLALAHRIVDSRTPKTFRDTLRKARSRSADWILANIAGPLSREGKTVPTIRNVWHALRCSPSPKHFAIGLRCMTNLVGPRPKSSASP